jgi:phosphoglycolate phosphatase-like HAD superfamily hydrolase
MHTSPDGRDPVNPKPNAEPEPDHADVEEFREALERYKRDSRRPYPTWREVLGVLRALGWRKGA